MVLMNGTRYTLTLDEFRLFHRIDRSLYIILVKELCRNPSECLHIMCLWLWLERRGFNNVIIKILSLPPFLMDEIADEALACLKAINNGFPFSSPTEEIPLTQTLVKKDLSLQLLQVNRVIIFQEIQSLIHAVYIPVLSDIFGRTGTSDFRETQVGTRSSTSQIIRPPPSSERKPMQNFSDLSIRGHAGSSSRSNAPGNESSRYDRTVFMTFYKGNPVSEDEIKQFFNRNLGDCIESFYLQEVKQNEQALYARIVFVRAHFIHSILNGHKKAKLTISGKHVWMRKFVPKNERILSRITGAKILK